MSTKDCPSCGATVPGVANLCKHCFHDFREKPAPSRRGIGLVAMLASFAASAVIGAGTLGYIASRPLEERILVDQDTRSIVWTRKLRTGIETDRISWDQVAHLEYVIKSGGVTEIVAAASNGDRKVIQSDKGPLKSEAEKYAKLMQKPLKEVDETGGIGKIPN